LYDATPVFAFSIEQEVAASYSNAFSGCSGLSNILNGLQRRPVPAGQAPKAIKRKPKAGKGKGKQAKAAGKGKGKGKAKANAKAAAVPASVDAAANVEGAPANVDAAAVPGAEAVGAVEAAPPLAVSRNAVASKAYRVAKGLAKTDGKSPAEQLVAAKTAYRDASAKWYQEQA
jgi:hypothetical protein